MVKEKPEKDVVNYDEKVSIKLNCAQIVPVKVKCSQTFPNKTKNTMKNINRINCL
jgi:hypothetical protein